MTFTQHLLNVHLLNYNFPECLVMELICYCYTLSLCPERPPVDLAMVV